MATEDSRTGVEDPDALLLVGRVGKTHGLRGEVKVIPETDDPTRFASLATVFLGRDPGTSVPYPVASARLQQTKRGTTVVLKVEGVDTVDEAAALRGRYVYARAADLPPLAPDEYFIHDLIGFDVVSDRGEAVGTVKDVLELPAQHVLVIARPGRPDGLVPAVPAFVDGVDLDGRRLVVRLIEGLFE